MPVGPRADTYEPEKHLYRGSRGSEIHARIAEEEGLFTMDDVIQSIIDKMVRRHPHVFGDSDGPGTDGSQASWDEIKRQEKQGKEWTEEYLPEAFEEAKELIEAAKKRKGFDTKKAE